MRQQITVLGATGSIGVSTLDVISQHTDKYSVFALTGNQKIDLLATQCIKHSARYAVVIDPQSAVILRSKLKSADAETEVLCGVEALSEVSDHADVDIVMVAIVGAAGLLPTLSAANAGKKNPLG